MSMTVEAPVLFQNARVLDVHSGSIGPAQSVLFETALSRRSGNNRRRFRPAREQSTCAR